MHPTPRSPQRGAPYTFVTIERFLVASGLETLQDLPDREHLDDAGFTQDPGTPPGLPGDLESGANDIQLNPDDLYDVGFWRQSGALHRTGGTAVSREKAIKEVKTALNRSGIEFVRFATNDTREVEVWRAIYHGKGTREGRRLGGASIKRVLWQD